jgi:monothiol glutaredoxin
MTTPTLTVTDAARQAITASSSGDEAPTLRITIGERFDYGLSLDPAGDVDVVVRTNGVSIVLDPASAARADGLTLDFVDGPGDGGGFSIENPNAPAAIHQITARELKAMMDAGETFELLDVRTPGERAMAKIEGSRLLDQNLHDHLMTVDRNTPLVFQCHHGMRSQSAAEHFQRAGFRRLYNLSGGIEAWSQMVDPSVPRY